MEGENGSKNFLYSKFDSYNNQMKFKYLEPKDFIAIEYEEPQNAFERAYILNIVSIKVISSSLKTD